MKKRSISGMAVLLITTISMSIMAPTLVAEAKKKTPLARPALYSMTCVTGNKIRLSFSRVRKAKKYQVKINNKTYTTKKTTYVSKAVKAGKYTAKVRAIATGRKSKWSLPFTLTVTSSISNKKPIKFSLQLPTIPCDFNEKWGEEIEQTLSLTEIGYRLDEYGYLILTYSGEKTYDKRGTNKSSSFIVSWKIYEESGAIATSGSFSTPSMCVGERIENNEDHANFKPDVNKKYKLVIVSD